MMMKWNWQRNLYEDTHDRHDACLPEITQLGQRHTTSNWRTEQNIHFECFAAFFNALNHFMVFFFNLSEQNSSGFCVFFYLKPFTTTIWTITLTRECNEKFAKAFFFFLLCILKGVSIGWKPEYNVVTFENLLNVYLYE